MNPNTPTKKQVQKVIDTLKLSLEKFGGVVDMRRTNIGSCGTPMCHAGHYGAILGAIYYQSGANLLARDLGFGDLHDLSVFAGENFLWWGNDNGLDMFYYECAFDKCESLQDIIDHWEGVKTRSRDEE